LIFYYFAAIFIGNTLDPVKGFVFPEFFNDFFKSDLSLPPDNNVDIRFLEGLQGFLSDG